MSASPGSPQRAESVLRRVLREELAPIRGELAEVRGELAAHLGPAREVAGYLDEDERVRWTAWLEANREQWCRKKRAGTIRRWLDEGRLPRRRTVEDAWAEIDGGAWVVLDAILAGDDEEGAAA